MVFKTIAKYLGDDYEVQASVGHIRDLIEPKNLPPELKKGSLGKFSVDIENDFEPYYVVSEQKRKTVADLKRALKRPTSSTSQLMRTARVKPSPGTSCKC